MEYTINVEPDIKPEQIKIKKVSGNLQREISPANKNGIYAYKNYTTYYVFEIPVLNYTLVNLESGEKFKNSMKLTLITSREPLLEELAREYETELGNCPRPGFNIKSRARSNKPENFHIWSLAALCKRSSQYPDQSCPFKLDQRSHSLYPEKDF